MMTSRQQEAFSLYRRMNIGQCIVNVVLTKTELDLANFTHSYRDRSAN